MLFPSFYGFPCARNLVSKAPPFIRRALSELHPPHYGARFAIIEALARATKVQLHLVLMFATPEFRTKKPVY